MSAASRDQPQASAKGLTEERIAELVNRHQSALLRYASRFLNNSDVAQDVVQEAFIKLWKAWSSGLRETEKTESWLYRVTHNLAIDHIRQEGRLRKLHEEHGDMDLHAPTAAMSMSADERQAMVLRSLHRLDDAEREVLVLRLQEGRSYKEISAITNRSEGNVGCLLHHAVKKLAKIMQKQGMV